MTERIELSRRAFLASSGVALAGMALGAQADPAPPVRPNILLLIIDTLRADALGCHGNPLGASVELDALAAEGVQFMNAISASSWTLPSIGSLITGRYPRTLGLYDTTDYLADHAPSIAQSLQAAGYATWGITANAVINSVAGFGRGFQQYQDANINWEHPGKRTASSDAVFRDALALVRAKDAAIPGYLQINIMETHEYYRGAGRLTRPEFDALYPEVTASAGRRAYFQALRQASIDTGKFIRELRALPGWSDTVVVIAGDHGEGLNDHPRVWQSSSHGALLYASNVSVPLIVHGLRGTPRPGKVYEPVSLLDIHPTLLEVAGVALPPGCEGQSLLPTLRGETPLVRGPLITETYNANNDKIACHSSAWSYLHHRDYHAGCSEFELQPLRGYIDGKHTNRIQAHPDIARDMANAIKTWEATHPKRPAIKVSEVGDAGDRQQQLEALGYL